MSAELDEYREGVRQRWIEAMHKVVGMNPADRIEWRNQADIVAILKQFTGSDLQHTYLPTGGGMAMLDVTAGHERGTIEMIPHDKTAYVLKPQALSINYIASDPAQSFVYITTDRLEPTGVYEDLAEDYEEVAEIDRGQYVSRGYWDQGEYPGTHGPEPLPSEARLLCRFLSGSFMIVGEDSMWNGTADTYDGEHDKMGETEVRRAIEVAIARRHREEEA